MQRIASSWSLRWSLARLRPSTCAVKLTNFLRKQLIRPCSTTNAPTMCWPFNSRSGQVRRCERLSRASSENWAVNLAKNDKSKRGVGGEKVKQKTVPVSEMMKLVATVVLFPRTLTQIPLNRGLAWQTVSSRSLIRMVDLGKADVSSRDFLAKLRRLPYSFWSWLLPEQSFLFAKDNWPREFCPQFIGW